MQNSPNRDAGIRASLLVMALGVYLLTPRLTREQLPVPGHFPSLAKCFLDGRFGAPVDEMHRIDELIPSHDGRSLYFPYPPLPAMVLAPFVWLFGSLITIQAACRAMSAVNVVLFDAFLTRLPARLGFSAPMGLGLRLLLDAFFAFGTTAWHNANIAGDWHFAHAVALGCMLLAMREFAGLNRHGWVGVFVGLALLARPTAALTAAVFMLPLVRARRLGALAELLAGPAAAMGVLMAYNFARFGSTVDFGYSRMLLSGVGKEVMRYYGQFHPHFVWRNFYWFFLVPPVILWRGGFPLPGFDPRGTGMFFVTPAFGYIFAGLRRAKRSALVVDAFVGIGLALVPLLLYFNTGFWQFGHRFSMDYLHLLMLLLVIGIGPRPSRLAYVVIGLSIVIQAYGVTADPFGWVPEWMAPAP